MTMGGAVLVQVTRCVKDGFGIGGPADVDATAVQGMFCRRVSGWAVFYAATRSPFAITILHVASLNPHSFQALESEAETRLHRLKR